jgi:hypothetical protein
MGGLKSAPLIAWNLKKSRVFIFIMPVAAFSPGNS